MSLPVPIPSPTEIYEWYKSSRKWWADKKWKEIVKAMSLSRENVLLYKFLSHIYRFHYTLKCNNLLYPLAIFIAPRNQWHDPESILHSLKENQEYKFESHLFDEGEKYRKAIEATGVVLEDLPTYRMLNLMTNGGLKLACATGYYFDSIRTCDVLEYELLRKFYNNTPRESAFVNFLRKELELRMSLHKVVSDPVVDGAFRSAAIAISTLIIFNDSDRCYRILLRQRSRRVAVHTDLFHVIPSFMFQPLVGDVKNEFSVRHNIYREYLEEVFAAKEVEKPVGETFDYFYGNPNLEYLKELTQSGEAKLLLTGVTVNLLNLRPEICTILLIRTPEWFRLHRRGDRRRGISRLKFNYEFKSVQEILRARSRVITTPLLDSSFSFPSFITPANIVPPGAAAISLGLEVAKEVLAL